MNGKKIPQAREIEVNRWYNTLINQNIELCKIVRAYNIGGYNGVSVYDWKVTSYYNGKELFAGSLGECRKWLVQRIIL